MVTVPAGEPATSADRTQPSLGGLAGIRSSDQEQFVARAQDGVAVGDDGCAVTDDQRDHGGRGQPQLEDGNPVQPGANRDGDGQQVRVQDVQRCGFHLDLAQPGRSGQTEQPGGSGQAWALDQSEDDHQDEHDVQEIPAAGHTGDDRERGEHDRHSAAQPGPGDEGLFAPRSAEGQQAGDGAEAIERARAEKPDLAILDIAMPRLTGLQAARELSRLQPDLRILILTMYDNEQYFFEALKAGASGYVLKSVVDRDLVEACRAAIRGEPFLYPGAITALIRNYLDRARRGDGIPAKAITDREEEILKLVAEGHTSKEIADILVISVKTVERHRANLLQKLGLRDRLELTRYAIRAGLIEP